MKKINMWNNSGDHLLIFEILKKVNVNKKN